MLGKRPIPVIGNLTNCFVSGNRTAGLMDVATSPRSPLEFKIQSPRGMKHYDLGGVGLGIVAALEKSAHSHANENLTTKALCHRNINGSNPIPVNPARNFNNRASRKAGFEEVEMDSMEDYTFVTCHGPGNKPSTRVYCDGGSKGYERSDFDRNSSRSNRPSLFTLSPARFDNSPAIPTSDFLNSCNLCHKKLQGKDIYMYRGEKAFCSSECRYSHMMMDEHKDKCSSEASRSVVEASRSPYKNGHGQIFSPGIFAI